MSSVETANPREPEARDISRGEFVEMELDTFIGRQDKKRRKEEGERAAERFLSKEDSVLVGSAS